MNISHHAKQLGFWESTPSLLGDGKKRAKSKRTVLQEVKGVSSEQRSKSLAEESGQLELFAMQGSALVPNVTILSDNLNTLANDTQRLSAFVKLEADSILRGRNCSPFYNELCNMIFKGLSLPTLTDSADSDLNWLGGYANKMSANSWFSTTVNSHQSRNSWQICCPSSTVSLLGFTDSENSREKSGRSYGQNPFKTRQHLTPNSVVKIPVFPCEALHKTWKQWLAAYRWVYNQCIQFFNSGFVLPKGLSLDQHIQSLQQISENE